MESTRKCGHEIPVPAKILYDEITRLEKYEVIQLRTSEVMLSQVDALVDLIHDLEVEMENEG